MLSQTGKKRMTVMQEDWTKSRSNIINWIVSGESQHSDKCSVCLESGASVRCHECGLSFYLCSACDEKVHSLNPFHDRQAWNGLFMKQLCLWKNLMETERLHILIR